MYTQIPDDLANDPWFKIVDFLQHNWAVIVAKDASSRVVFYGDTCGIFDEMEYDSRDEAVSALRRSSFARYGDVLEAQEFIVLPRGEFHERPHPNGRIYSSGRFWR